MSGDRGRSRLTWFFALAALLFLALWAWSELRLRAERELTRTVEAEKNVLEGEARHAGIRDRLKGRRSGAPLEAPTKVVMSPVGDSEGPGGRIFIDGSSGRIFGFFERLDTSREGLTYQLWFRPVAGPPESVGTVAFDAEGDGIVTSPGLPADHVTGEFVLTLEHTGGALVPTGPDVLRGALEHSASKADTPGDEPVDATE